MRNYNSEFKVVGLDDFDNILISYALLIEEDNEDTEERKILDSLIGQSLDGWAGLVHVDEDEFLAYRKHLVSNNAVLYLLCLANLQGEILDVEAFLLEATEDEDGGVVVYIHDLKENNKKKRYELL